LEIFPDQDPISDSARIHVFLVKSLAKQGNERLKSRFDRNVFQCFFTGRQLPLVQLERTFRIKETLNPVHAVWGAIAMVDPANRREFLQNTVAAGTALSWGTGLLAAQKNNDKGVPTRPLGTTGAEVSILCLGGWHLGAAGKEDEQAAIRLVHRALDEGVTFLDNCWDYHNGYSEKLMGRAIHDRRDKFFLMTKNCERDYEGSKRCLDESLKRLQTDHLDLWQFHEMVYDNDPDWVFDKGGMKAALEAQQAGKVRFIGFTGHKDPSIHLKMLHKPYLWASAQMPINICDYFFRSFQHQVLPVCVKQGTGVLGMKSLGGGLQGKIPASGLVTAKECLQFALSRPISSLVCGMLNEKDLDQALSVARNFEPLSLEAERELLAKVEEQSGDGHLELFKTSKDFDGPHHRKQHGFAV
jgi:predicted aldo/keto reductase-like oxidoreductase